MNVEKIGEHKIRIFISYDDLADRGIDREDIWQNGRKVQELFWDMMERAYLEVGFEVIGPIAVEAFTMPTEGVIVIVTQVPSLPDHEDPLEDDIEVIHNPEIDSTTNVFVFADFEDVIGASGVLALLLGIGTSLYFYKDRYYLHVMETAIPDGESDNVWAILHEYGDHTTVSSYMLDEYGQCIIRDEAVETLSQHFSS